WRNMGHGFHSVAGPIRVLDEQGGLVPACNEILDIIKEHDAVLASGHLSTAEPLVLLPEARRRGIRCVITHATFIEMPVEAQQQLAGLGCYIEQCGMALFRDDAEEGVQRILSDVRAVGPEHVILSTDLGQAKNPDPAVGFGMWFERFLADRKST